MIDHVVFVIEFKVGETQFSRAAIDQVWDYAPDLRNFHETSHGIPIAPVLVATQAKPAILGVTLRANDAWMPEPVCVGATQIRAAITQILDLEVEKISVSLESADPATFRHIRGGKLRGFWRPRRRRLGPGRGRQEQGAD